MEEPLRALSCLDRQIRPGGVADEQRVSGEDDPGIRTSSAVAHREAVVLRPVTGRMDASQDDVSEHDLVAVLERVVRVFRLRRRVDAHGNAVLEGEPAVPGKVVGVRVGLDHADDADVVPLGLLDVLLDRERRVDDDGLTGSRIADDVRRTPERIVDELREDHGRGRPYQRLPLFLLKCQRPCWEVR